MIKDLIDFKALGKNAIKWVLFIVAFWAVYFYTGLIGILIILFLYYAFLAYTGKIPKEKLLQEYGKGAAFITGLILLSQWINSTGKYWLHIVWLIGLPILIIIKRWKTYMWAIETVQTSIFGEPVKDIKARGEPLPKIKFKLKK